MGIISEMRKVCQQRKPNAKGKMVYAGYWFNTLFVRHFSIYITWLFVKMGISANAVTFLMIPIGVIGVALCVPHVLWVNILGFLLLILAEVFDCVDGEIARWAKKSSVKGLYLDLVSHVLCNAPPFMLCGLHLYVLNGRTKYMILAFLAYATAQWRLGLSEVYYRIKVESSSTGASEFKDSASSRSTFQKWPYGMWAIFNLAKRLLPTLTDIMVTHFVSFACICLSYAGVVGIAGRIIRIRERRN